LYRRYHYPDGTTKYLQVVIPTALRRPYVERLHADIGHFGRTETCLALARRAYFPGWRVLTGLLVRNCPTCNLNQRDNQKPRQATLRPMKEFRPMAVVHADLVGPLPEGKNSRGQRGFQYILSVVDSATRYLWLLPIRHKTAECVAATLFDEVFSRVSVPSANSVLAPCSCPLFDTAILNRSLLAMTMGLFKLFVRAERHINNASLIGCCANVLASSPGVNNYPAVSVVACGDCCYLFGARIVWRAILFDISLLRVYSAASSSSQVVNMSNTPEIAVSTNPQTANDSGAADTPPGGALYSWPHDPIPATGGESGVTLSRPVNIPAQGRARPTSGGPRVPFPPLEAYEL